MPSKIPSFRPQGLPDACRSYERGRQRQEDKAFYCSKEWRRLRAAFLAANPLCSDCQNAGRVTAAVHVHHVVDRKKDPSRALDRDNLEAACQPCHNAKRK